MSAEEMAEAMYPESEMTYGYQAVREAFEYGYAAAKRVQPSREDAVRAIRAADWWPVDAPHGLDGIAADAVLALFAQQPTVAEVRQGLVTRIENELDHAHLNEHHLAPDCQGVTPGEIVPAVRTSFIRAALEARP